MDYSDQITQSFDEIFNSITEEIDPSNNHNGTGYFDSLASEEFDSPKAKRFTDNHGRRGFVIPNGVHAAWRYPVGGTARNLVFFERYSDSDMIVSQHHKSHFNEWIYQELNTLLYEVSFLEEGNYRALNWIQQPTT